MQQELQRLVRILAAYDYFTKENSLLEVRADANKTLDLIETAKTCAKQASLEQKTLKKQLDDMAKRKSSEATAPMEEATATENKEAQALIRASAAMTSCKETNDGEKSSLNELVKRESELNTSLGSVLIAKLQTSKEKSEQSQKELKDARSNVETCERSLEAAESGVDGTNGSVQEQIIQHQAKEQASGSIVKQERLKEKHLKNELKTCEDSLSAELKKSGSNKTNFTALAGEIETLKKQKTELLQVESLPPTDAGNIMFEK